MNGSKTEVGVFKILSYWWHSHKGATLVEFAIILPVILALAAGTWEFGRVFDAYIVATNAAREGARWASLGQSEALVQDRVWTYLQEGYGTRADVNYSKAAIDVTPNGGGLPGDEVQVVVPVSVALYMPGPIGLVGGAIAVDASATMRLQMPQAGAP